MMKNFEMFVDEIITRNKIKLENGYEYYTEDGANGLVRYKEVVNYIKKMNDIDKEKFIKTVDYLEKQDLKLERCLDRIAMLLI